MASRVKRCDLREVRFLADDDTVEPPDTRQIVTSPGPLGMGQRCGIADQIWGYDRAQPPTKTLVQDPLVCPNIEHKKRFDVDHLLREELSHLERVK